MIMKMGNLFCMVTSVTQVEITVRGKNLEGENFGEFGERLAIRQNFPHQCL